MIEITLKCRCIEVVIPFCTKFLYMLFFAIALLKDRRIALSSLNEHYYEWAGVRGSRQQECHVSEGGRGGSRREGRSLSHVLLLIECPDRTLAHFFLVG